jgi:hypothetical protein
MLDIVGNVGAGNVPAAVKSLSRDDIAEALTESRPAAGYVPTLPVSSFTAEGYTPSIWEFERNIEAMVAHPAVQAPLLYYRSGISGAEFEVTATSEDVRAFVETTVRDMWEKSLPDVQTSYEFSRVGCEVVYKDEGGLAFDGLQSFSPEDCTPVVEKASKEYAGFRLRGVPDSTEKEGVFLWGPAEDMPAKGFWYAHRPRFNPFYGRSQLWGAYRPWKRLCGLNGAENTTDWRCTNTGFGPRRAGIPWAVRRRRASRSGQTRKG